MHKQDIHTTENLSLTNPEADYSCFAIWKEANPYISEIRAYLSTRFEILLETKIIWSEAYFKQNAARLYEVPIFGTLEKEAIPVDHTTKIGATAFTIIVVKDHIPRYQYHPSVSGSIQRCNSAVVEAKETFRSWVAKKSKFKYSVHATTTFEEFCFQVPLLLGVENFRKLITGKKVEIPSLQKDLEGAGGWETANEMFEVLNCTTTYVLLRNFEMLPVLHSVIDFDFLTYNYQRLASAMGLQQKSTKPFKGMVTVEKGSIPVDIRFVGDNYYCGAWAATILRNRTLASGIFIPATDDYFFSLFYHVAVQKPTIELPYKIKLNALAKNLSLDWFSEEILLDEQKVGALLNGYMGVRGYFYERPIDSAVYENKNVASQLRRRSDLVVGKSLKLKIKQAVLPFVPKSWYFYYLTLRTGKPNNSDE